MAACTDFRTIQHLPEVSVKGITSDRFDHFLRSIHDGITSARSSLVTYEGEEDRATSMCKAVSFLSDSTVWLVREGESIRELGVATACDPLRGVSEMHGRFIRMAMEA